VSPGPGAPLRVALLRHDYGRSPASASHLLVRDLADSLHAAGHRPCVLSSHRAATRRSIEGGIPVVRVRRPPDSLLRRRRFVAPLTHVPLTVGALLAGNYDVAHAFSPEDAGAALVWRRLARRPALFTCTEPLRRELVADRRLRLWLLRHAVEDSDLVTVPTEESRAALWRWLAVDAPVMSPSDARAHERMYRASMAGRATC
jgi:glycosyl transferase family 4